MDNCLSASSLVSHIYTFFSLNMSEHVSFLCFILCLFSVYLCPHRLSRATYQHIFSRLVGAQFADCITCLANTYFVLVCTGYYIFASLLIFLSLNMSVYVSFLLFHIFPSQCAPIGSLERPWTTTQKGWSHYLDVQRATLVPICLSAYIHVCSALPYKIHLTQFRFN